MKKPGKSILVPVDGSENSFRSLDYLEQILGPHHDLEVHLLYVLPKLPPILTDATDMDSQMRRKMKQVTKNNRQLAEEIITQARQIIEDKGYNPDRIRAEYINTRTTTAKQITELANSRHVDAVLMNRRGRSDLKNFFMGSVSRQVIEYNPFSPVWIAGGNIKNKKILIALDSSENALRAVDHVAFMLAGTDCGITLLHAMRHLQKYVPMKVLEAAPDLEKLWEKKAGEVIQPVMEKAHTMLLEAGIAEEQIQRKIIHGTRSAANDIMAEALKNGYGTIVLGRRGISALKSTLFGSVTVKILNSFQGVAVWIV